MRAGDVYKVNSMLKDGFSEEEIINKFKLSYPESEVKKFLPAKKKTKAK